MSFTDDPNVADFTEITLLQTIPLPERVRLAKECVISNVSKGQAIFLEGHKDTRGVAFLLRGRLSVRGSSVGGKEIVYALVTPGGHTGEFSALEPDAPRSATVEADIDSVVAFMPSGLFRHVVTNNPAVSQAVIDSLLKIARSSSERIVEFATTGSRERVCREILRLVDVAHPDLALSVLKVELSGVPDQGEIARRTGMTRESVNRVLSRFQKSGIIRKMKQDTFVIENLPALRAMSEAE